MTTALASKMKRGRYVHVIRDASTSSWVCANLMNHALLEVPDDDQPVFDRILRKPNEAVDPTDDFAIEVKKLLIDTGFLIKDGVDELSVLENRYEAQKQSNRAANLAIVVTHKCNLRCIYCYQKHFGSQFSDEDAHAVLAFVDRVTQSVKKLGITWWGGEALLKPDIIRSLSSRFLAICDQRDVEYSAYTATNGVLLTPDICRLLKECKVERLQITVDGPKSSHDHHRPQANGNGSYDAILRGLDNLAQQFGRDNAFITLRINMSAELNVVASQWQAFFDDLAPFRDMVRLTIQPVVGTFRFCAERALSPRSFLESLFELERNAQDQGFCFVRHDQAAYPGRVHCTAVLDNNWIVLPGRRLVKCTTDFHDASNDCGQLESDGSLTLLKTASSWAGYSPFKEARCRGCDVLPLCMGGCRIVPFDDASASRCSLRRTLAESLLTDPRRRRHRSEALR